MRWQVAVSIAVVVLKITVLFVLAANTRFVMDEFWHFAQSNYVFDGFFDTIWPEKAVGYALFYKLAHLIGWDARSMLLTGRLLTAVLVVLLLWVVFRTTRSLGRSSQEAILVVMVLLCFSTFIERSFRLRSEPLALLFAATALMIVLRGSADKAGRLLGAGLLCGLAFVTTQKSVYFNVALGAGLVADALAARSVGRAAKRSLFLILGWAVAVGCYGLTFGGWNVGPVLRALFFGPLEVAMSGDSYYSGLRFYLWQTLGRNAILYLLCFAGLGLALGRFKAVGAPGRIHLVHTLVITLLVFTHNQPWPYVFTMALPFLAPYSLFVVDRAGKGAARTGLIALVLLAVGLSFLRNGLYLAHDNSAQLKIVDRAESIMAPGDTYFDGIGMVPSRTMSPLVWLDAMGVARVRSQAETSEVVRSLKDHPPTVIIETYRTGALAPVIGDWMAAAYVRVFDNIRIQGTEVLPDASADLPVLQRQSFTAVRADTGEPLTTLRVDGVDVPLPVELEVGVYQVEAVSVRALVFAGAKVVEGVQAEPQQLDLFDGIYDF